MSNAFPPVLRARPCPIFGRPVHPGFPPIDYSPTLLLKPFGFRITPDTLSSTEISRWPARHYPRLWIQRPSSERRRDFNPPDSCAAQRTVRIIRMMVVVMMVVIIGALVIIVVMMVMVIIRII